MLICRSIASQTTFDSIHFSVKQKKSHTRIISENYAEALIAYTRATRIAISALSENARSGVARNFFGAVV